MKIDFNQETIYVTKQEIETFNVLKENIKEQQSYVGDVNLKEFNIVVETTEPTCHCYGFDTGIANPYLTEITCNNEQTDIT